MIERPKNSPLVNGEIQGLHRQQNSDCGTNGHECL